MPTTSRETVKEDESFIYEKVCDDRGCVIVKHPKQSQVVAVDRSSSAITSVGWIACVLVSLWVLSKVMRMKNLLVFLAFSLCSPVFAVLPPIEKIDPSQHLAAIIDLKNGAKNVSPDGTEEVMIDLPVSEMLKNTGGTDGAGLCVNTSIEIAGGRWTSDRRVCGLQERSKTAPGGSYPDKVDQQLGQWCPGVDYIQYTGSNIEVLKRIIRTRRAVAITYGYSSRYGDRVPHMSVLLHLSDKWACVYDVNFPGTVEWMTPSEFKFRWADVYQGGWAVACVETPPPPIPSNTAPKEFAAGFNLVQWRGGSYCPTCPQGIQGGGYSPYPMVPYAPLWVDPSPRVEPAGYTWERDTKKDYLWHLMRGSKQVGVFSATTGQSYLRIGEDLVEGTLPVAIPSHVRRSGTEVDPPSKWVFGVAVDKVDKVESYRICHSGLCQKGTGCPPLDFGAKVADIPDDTALPYLVVIGEDSQTSPVVADLKKGTGAKDVIVKAYPPTHWAVANVGYNLVGSPRVIATTAPNSKGVAQVVFSDPTYRGASEVFAALRRKLPDYKPESDPKSNDSPLSRLPAWVVPVGLGVAVLVLVLALFPVLREKVFLALRGPQRTPQVVQRLKTVSKPDETVAPTTEVAPVPPKRKTKFILDVEENTIERIES